MKQLSQVKLKKESPIYRNLADKTPWASFSKKYENVDVLHIIKCGNGKSLLKNKAFIWGIFIATGLFGLFPNECLAVSDATLKAKWDSSGIQKLLTKDARTIAAIIAAGVGGIMVMMPAKRQPKSDFIWVFAHNGTNITWKSLKHRV